MLGRRSAGWASSAQALGAAAQELARAELAALGDDFSRAGRRLVVALLLLCAALFTLFWALGLTLYLAVELLVLWWPRWAAVTVVLAAALAAAALCALIGRRRLRAVDSPATLLERRWRSHRHWWQSRLGPDSGGAEGDVAPPGEAG